MRFLSAITGTLAAFFAFAVLYGLIVAVPIVVGAWEGLR